MFEVLIMCCVHGVGVGIVWMLKNGAAALSGTFLGRQQ